MINCPMNMMMDCIMATPCCVTNAPGGMASNCCAKMMQPIMRHMMNDLMHVTDHYNDATYKEVQDFMVPSSVGNPFVDAPGTFDEGMEPRMSEVGFRMMGMNAMRMSRVEMAKAGPPHNKGITFAKFAEHRGYASPGYVPKHPKPGEVAPDGPIFKTDGSLEESTLLTEAKKMAEAAGSDKVIICFDAITCPFFRAYAAEDLYKVANGVPQLHVYLREAEPCDTFDAGGMHCVTPLKMKRFIPEHKTPEDRAQAAQDTKTFLETFEPNVNMWMDGMDDKLEAAYEARPWRWYVIEVATMKIIQCTGLAPFNMKGKLANIKAACADGAKAPAEAASSAIAPDSIST